VGAVAKASECNRGAAADRGGDNQGAAAEMDAIREQLSLATWDSVVLARDATAQGCWCIRAEGYARPMQM